MMNSSKDKILKNIRKNSLKKIELKDFNDFDFEPVIFENPLDEFVKNFKAAGGKIETKKDGVVLKGIFGVAENGAILLEDVEDPKLYTFFETITITLKKENILHNMHQAYENLKIKDFALFMSGPSKTADIEQSLVIGAHGAKEVYLVFE